MRCAPRRTDADLADEAVDGDVGRVLVVVLAAAQHDPQQLVDEQAGLGRVDTARAPARRALQSDVVEIQREPRHAGLWYRAEHDAAKKTQW